PVIASPVGVNTDYIRQGGGCLADGASDWVDKLCQLISDPQLRKQMGQVGKAKVQQFDLRVLGRVLVRLINRYIEGE
ncbi:MAG: group 1 glycosyl transferase, partial [Sedimentisphaerales bacterium]